jgi:hypothetical protein
MLMVSAQAMEADPASGAEGVAEAAPVRLRSKVARRPHELGLPGRAIVDAYSIGLGPSLDLAHGWDCPNGAECVNRAFAGELFPTEAEARSAVKNYMLDVCRQMFGRRDAIRTYRELSRADGFEPVHILRVEGELEACHDYRQLGCQLQNAFEQLRQGAGAGDAWSMARENRRHYGALTARLPGKTSEGLLFAFVSGCADLEVTSVTTARPPDL